MNTVFECCSFFKVLVIVSCDIGKETNCIPLEEQVLVPVINAADLVIIPLLAS
jgi:hypothetical protein